MATFPEQIDLARAALGDAPVYKRRGVERRAASRARRRGRRGHGEHRAGRLPLGRLLSDRTRQIDAARDTRAFATWEPLESRRGAGELASVLGVARLAFGLTLRAEGLSFRAYCYNASAENTYLRRLGVGRRNPGRGHSIHRVR